MTLNRFFVYGTLCEGNSRSGMWPHAPMSIESGWIRAALYDGPGYPAIRLDSAALLDSLVAQPDLSFDQHHDRVKGELWTFREDHVSHVTKVLDRIEGTNQTNASNLYDRIIVETFDWKNQSLGKAWTYQYACDPNLHRFKRIAATQIGGVVHWLEEPN